MVIEPPKGFEPVTITLRRKWRSYSLTVMFDARGATWGYIVARSTTFFVANGRGFPTPHAAGAAAMIKARIDFGERHPE